MGNRPIRIANCSGYFGDRMSALAEVAAEPDVDVITGDYLAEVTMLVLAKTRARNPDGGYASTFPAQLRPALAAITARGIKVVSNAGGLNPHGLANVLRTQLDELELDLSVAVVDGDDLTGRLADLQAAGHGIDHLGSGAPLAAWAHQPLTANAYLGAWGITAALQHGADIVITGRVTDASVVVGAAAWWHGWARDDFDTLAGAVAAGHVIECGTQATGGNYSGFTLHSELGAGTDSPAFPIAQIEADGSSIITKATGGGVVTVGTVTAQLLYEIGGPHYLNPDVTALFDTVRLEQVGADAVRLYGTRGVAPPATTKVAITALGGHRNEFSTVVTGLDLDAKIAWFEGAVRRAAASIGVAEIVFEQLGVAAVDPASQGAASVLVRVTVSGDEHAVGRRFGAAIIELALANYPGFYGLSLPGAATAYGTYWPGLIDQRAIEHRVTHADGTVTSIEGPPVGDPTRTVLVAADVGDHDDERYERDPAVALTVAPLGLIADARSGDKGGDANVGIWVRDRSHWPWLRDTMDLETFRRLVPEAAELPIDRFEFPHLGAVNFVTRGLLGEGATANTRLDAQAKALGEYVRARYVEMPQSWAKGSSPRP